MSICKKALEEAGGDMEKALTVLQKESAKSAEKKADRALGSGVIEAYRTTTKKSESFWKLKANLILCPATKNSGLWPKISLCISPPQVHPI